MGANGPMNTFCDDCMCKSPVLVKKVNRTCPPLKPRRNIYRKENDDKENEFMKRLDNVEVVKSKMICNLQKRLVELRKESSLQEKLDDIQKETRKRKVTNGSDNTDISKFIKITKATISTPERKNKTSIVNVL